MLLCLNKEVCFSSLEMISGLLMAGYAISENPSSYSTASSVQLFCLIVCLFFG